MSKGGVRVRGDVAMREESGLKLKYLNKVEGGKDNQL